MLGAAVGGMAGLAGLGGMMGAMPPMFNPALPNLATPGVYGDPNEGFIKMRGMPFTATKSDIRQFFMVRLPSL